MTSTRLSTPSAVLGFAPTDGRQRTDPVKLLGLIQRIKDASGTNQRPAIALTTTPDRKVG